MVRKLQYSRTTSIVNQAPIDAYDIAILSALAEDNRVSTSQLAPKVHLSRSAVTRRIAALKKAGILKNSPDIVELRALRLGLHAFVEISSANTATDSLMMRLLEEPEVLEAYIVSGDELLLLKVATRDTDHLKTFVQALQKFGKTSTRIIFGQARSRVALKDRVLSARHEG